MPTSSVTGERVDDHFSSKGWGFENVSKNRFFTPLLGIVDVDGVIQVFQTRGGLELLYISPKVCLRARNNICTSSIQLEVLGRNMLNTHESSGSCE